MEGDFSTIWSGSRTEFDGIIRCCDQSFVVFDGDNTVFAFDKQLDALNESLDILEMQTGGRFIHDDQRSAGVIEVGSEFQSHHFASREGRETLADG